MRKWTQSSFGPATKKEKSDIGIALKKYGLNELA
jgi:hypothetical protein